MNMSQTTLAEKVGISQSAISMIENGERTPSLGVLLKLADVLGCTVGDLLENDTPA